MDVRGTFERYLYTNANGISDFRLMDETGAYWLFRGCLTDIKPGMKLLLRGITSADKDGYYTFQSAHPQVSSEDEAVLALSCADGISKKSAQCIINALGMDIYSYVTMSDIKNKLLALPGFGDAKVSSLLHYLDTQANNNENYLWLIGRGFSYTTTMQIIKEHGKEARNYIESEPYSQLYDHRANFEICDQIAKDMGEDLWSVRRILAIIFAVLLQNKKSGNTRMEMTEFAKRCVSKSLWNGGSAVPDELFILYAYAENSHTTEVEDGVEYVYFKKSLIAERSIICDLKRLIASATKLPEPSDEIIHQIECETGIKYNAEQRRAFHMFSQGGALIMTGDPGTGKTTTIDGLIRYYRLHCIDAKILLCAPTGRAASRITEISGQKGLTMHKALKLNQYDASIKAAETLKEDLIIVDEMSMCDTDLFACFLSAIKSGATVILTGDPNQLPSVGPGRVFQDLIDSGKIPVYQLTELVRQKETSGIVANARAALARTDLSEYPDFKLIIHNVQEELADIAVNEAQSMSTIPLLLSPIKRGMSGTIAINRRMQNTFKSTDDYVTMNGIRYYVGDPVIMTHNNYKYGYLNGENGTLIRVNNGVISIALPGRILHLDISETQDVSMSYAVTIHRAQGAESENCIIILPDDATHMASGELLNTAFTRAKKNVTVIASESALYKFTHTGKLPKRECGLASKLKLVM